MSNTLYIIFHAISIPSFFELMKKHGQSFSLFFVRWDLSTGLMCRLKPFQSQCNGTRSIFHLNSFPYCYVFHGLLSGLLNQWTNANPILENCWTSVLTCNSIAGSEYLFYFNITERCDSSHCNVLASMFNRSWSHCKNSFNRILLPNTLNAIDSSTEALHERTHVNWLIFVYSGLKLKKFIFVKKIAILSTTMIIPTMTMLASYCMMLHPVEKIKRERKRDKPIGQTVAAPSRHTEKRW